MTVGIIFLICIILFIIDRFPTSVVALAGCCALVLFGDCTPQAVFSSFSSDIVLIVFGTEIFGIACTESGLARVIARGIRQFSGGKNEKSATVSIILLAGLIAAAASAFLNNQVVCTFMMVICISTAKEMKAIKVKDITLPVIYMAILGGQCTLIGAPATLVASSLAESETGRGISMFELLPMGAILLLIGSVYILIFGFGSGRRIWGERETASADRIVEGQDTVIVNRRKCSVTAFAGVVMMILFITEYVSVGTASIIGALICILGGVVDQKSSCAKVDWNIIIWLGCSIGIANALNDSGMVSKFCTVVLEHMPNNVSPILLLTMFVLITTIISNLIANTTTVIMVLPFAVQLTTELGIDSVPFIIAITMAAGLAILTPLSCGFIGMTMRLGYKFKDYVRYGMGLQLLLTGSVIVLTKVMYGV